MPLHKVALLTAGGLAPCLSAAVGGLIERYRELLPGIQIIGYRDGYKGLLLGQKIDFTDVPLEKVRQLATFGGSPLGNSRVKFTNVKDCVKRGLVADNDLPLAVAANQLIKDGVTILHTIGGDDTNLAAATLADFLKEKGHTLTVVGLPKTVDNDVVPIKQSLGAFTAAEEGMRFFKNVVSEHTANPNMLIVHEIMGRNCGWLPAYTAYLYYQDWLKTHFFPELGLKADAFAIHGLYIPELPINIESEVQRLKKVMKDTGCVNLFVSEGAGVENIIKLMEANGETIPRDAFGHVKLDAINVGQWFGTQFAHLIGAEKVLVQKSGYFARSAKANAADCHLIKGCVDKAVEGALNGLTGVVGHDETRGDCLSIIDFKRISGGKPFDVKVSWFQDLMKFICAH
jgi:pyrophosphate--fructose-6-phosphate 1-phosphotransferase